MKLSTEFDVVSDPATADRVTLFKETRIGFIHRPALYFRRVFDDELSKPRRGRDLTIRSAVGRGMFASSAEDREAECRYSIHLDQHTVADCLDRHLRQLLEEETPI